MSTVLLFQRYRREADCYSHRWNHEIKEWVKMSKDEEQRAKKAAVERKLEELKAKERSEPIEP